MQRLKIVPVVLLFLIAFAAMANAGPLPGAIFTTLVDGSSVNHNIYDAKEDVYLDGGPGPNAPSGAAALPEGDYYFQVTDPSGKVILSTDPVECRMVHVNTAGVIDYVYPATCTESVKIRGQWTELVSNCTHQTGIDLDHFELGAITVQLIPYLNTPNKGGVYKVWMTPVERFEGDPTLVDNGYSPGNYHGFIPAWSKTDNFKVKKGKPYFPPEITVRKFRDSNANGVWDAGENEIFGWQVDVTDPLAVTNTYYTPDTVTAEPEGTWTFVEKTPADWLQTALSIDGVAQPVSATAIVEVVGTSKETHEVIYGNIQLANITVCKFYDRDGDGEWDAGEPPVAGILFILDGINICGDVISLADYSGENGYIAFDGFLPGEYTICEVAPPDWVSTTPTCVSFTLAEGTDVSFGFGNVCVGEADFNTKGYWHNKNGLGETTLDDLAYLNSLAPWLAPSSYFGAGDEPINGTFSNGTPVAAVNGDWGDLIAPAGSPWAEQSHFLIDSNAGGDPREQLAQQLDAFVMNVLHRLDGEGATIQLPDSSWVSAGDLIADACEVWSSGSSAQRTWMAGLLDNLNNCDAVEYIHAEPCEVIYP